MAMLAFTAWPIGAMLNDPLIPADGDMYDVLELLDEQKLVNHEALERLAILWRQFPNLKTKGDQTLNSRELTLSYMAENGLGSAPDYPWIKSSYDPNGIVTLRMLVKGN